MLPYLFGASGSAFLVATVLWAMEGNFAVAAINFIAAVVQFFAAYQIWKAIK
jgi:hypothetical protein